MPIFFTNNFVFLFDIQEAPENLGMIPLESIKVEQDESTKNLDNTQQPLPPGEDR